MGIRVGYGHVYLITDGTYTKVGYSVDPVNRLAQLQTAHPKVLELVGAFEVERHMETVLHEELEAYHVRGEWYALNEDAHFRIMRLLQEHLGG